MGFEVEDQGVMPSRMSIGCVGTLWSFASAPYGSADAVFVAIKSPDGRISLGYLDIGASVERLHIGCVMVSTRVVNSEMPIAYHVMAWKPA